VHVVLFTCAVGQPWESAGTVSSNVSDTPGAAYSSNVLSDGPNGFGVRGYGGAAPVTPTSAPNLGISSGPASVGGTDHHQGERAADGSSTFESPAVQKSAVGYDLSQLLGADAARDAPWRPPPPPAATVQRPVSSGSTKDKQQLAGAESAPAAPAPAGGNGEVQPMALPTAGSAPPAPAAAVTEPLPEMASGREWAVPASAVDGAPASGEVVEQAA
jgi:hypothetical protein